jgi:hypothetical protein
VIGGDDGGLVIRLPVQKEEPVVGPKDSATTASNGSASASAVLAPDVLLMTIAEAGAAMATPAATVAAASAARPLMFRNPSNVVFPD